MSQAAAACQAVAFRGVQIADWWGLGGESASVIRIWHRPGPTILAETSSASDGSPSGRLADPGVTPGQDEMMTVSSPLLALMSENYQLTYGGRGTVTGRKAQVIDVRRPGGGLAARFWLDAATKLPLRRELFDSHGAMFSKDTFVGLRVGAGQLGAMPSADGQPWSGQLGAAGRAALRAKGWRLPAALADGLTMFKATESPAKSGKVVELSYSDGLSVISVFVQHGQLPERLPGWRRVAAPGREVYASDPDDRSLAWSADGFVYTMIADAPTGVVDGAVLDLPHDTTPLGIAPGDAARNVRALNGAGLNGAGLNVAGLNGAAPNGAAPDSVPSDSAAPSNSAAPGFWQRIGRGLRRIWSWVNPLG
jgi:hypothetical protein